MLNFSVLRRHNLEILKQKYKDNHIWPILFPIIYSILSKLTFVYIIFPIILTEKNLDIGLATLGLATHEGIKLLFVFPMGIIADKVGSARILILSRITSLIGVVFWIFCSNSVVYLLGFAAFGIASGMSACSFDAYLLYICKKNQKLFEKCLSLGSLFGNICSVCIGVLFGYMGKNTIYGLIFSFITIIYTIAYIAFVYFMEGDTVQTKQKNKNLLRDCCNNFIAYRSKCDIKFLVLILISSLSSALYISINDIHKIFMSSLNFNSNTIGGIYAIMHIGGAFVLLLKLFSSSPILSFKFVMHLTIGSLFVSCIGFAHNSKISSMIIIFFLITYYLREISLKSYIVLTCKQNITPSTFGLINTFAGGINIIVFLIFYFIVRLVPINICIMILCGISAMLFLFLFQLYNKNSKAYVSKKQ